MIWALGCLGLAVGLMTSASGSQCLTLHAAADQTFRVTGDAPPLQPPWVVLRFPTTIDPTKLEIYFDVGKPPLSPSRVVGRRDVFDYELGIRGDPGTMTHFTAVSHVPGFDYVFLDLDLTADESIRVILITLTPRPLLHVRARVLSPPGQNMAGLRVRVSYEQPWMCLWMGRYDCLVPSEELAGATVNADGSFEAEVPDVLSDPGLARFDEKSRGSFRFDMTRPGSPPTRYFLIAEGAARVRDISVSLRAEYLSDLVLRAEIR
jgi:hypothetical protein